MAYGNLVVIDFEGVIYKPGDAQDPDYILTGTPHKGAKEAIKYLSGCGYFIGVVSNECRTQSGEESISNWLKKHNIVVDNLYYRPPIKPVIYITKDNISSIEAFYNLIKARPIPDENIEKLTLEAESAIDSLRKFKNNLIEFSSSNYMLLKLLNDEQNQDLNVFKSWLNNASIEPIN